MLSMAQNDVLPGLQHRVLIELKRLRGLRGSRGLLGLRGLRGVRRMRGLLYIYC